MKKIFYSFIVLFIFLCGCKTNNVEPEIIEEVYNEVRTLISDDYITENLIFPSEIGEVKLYWTTSDRFTVSNNGVILRQEKDVFVTIYLTLEYQGLKFERNFEVVIKAQEENEKNKEYIDWLDSVIPDTVVNSFTLPLNHPTLFGNIEWSSSDESSITNNGIVNRKTNDEVTILTAIISYNGETIKKEYKILVKALEEKTIDISEIGNWLNLFIPRSINESIELPNTHPLYGGNITWKSNNNSVLSDEGIINREDKDVNIVLTAVINYNEKMLEKTFEIIVLKEEEHKFEISDFPSWLENIIPRTTESNLELPQSHPNYGGKISWKSKNEDIISSEGKVVRGMNDEVVTLVATIYYEGASFEKNFDIIVLKEENIQTSVDDIIIWINKVIPRITDSNIELPTTHPSLGGTITWKSNSENIITSSGKVIQGESIEIVCLIATVNYNNKTQEKEFYIVVNAKEKEITIEEISSWIDTLIPRSVDKNISLPIFHPDTNATIEWTTNNENVISSDGIVSRGEKDETVALTCSISYNGKILKKTYDVVVVAITREEKYQEVLESISEITSLANNEVHERIYFINDSLYGSKIVWESSREDIIGTNSTFNQPIDDTEVILGYQITIDNYTYPKVLFNVLVKGKGETVYSEYYNGIEGLVGEELKDALHDIIDGHTTLSYKIWDEYLLTDGDPDNPNNVILIYTGLSVPFTDHSTKWNREHVWAKSHGGFGEDRGAGSDLHHLRPCNSVLNSTRGNDDFAEGGNAIVKSTIPYATGSSYCYRTSSSFEPRDEDKGDVARMMFYMATRYESEDGVDLELNDSVGNGSKPYIGRISYLLKWHLEDPVDDREISRNEAVYKLQGNRNPYIDYPDLVEKIWGTSDNFLLLSSSTYKEPVIIEIVKIYAILDKKYAI